MRGEGRAGSETTAGDLAAEVVALAGRAGVTLGVAESLTGGLLASAVVDVPGASAVLAGGVVAYTAGAKVGVLGVAAELVAEVGTVDEEVARQMAQGVRELLGAQLGLATTGVAGPGPAEGHPPGTAWIAAASAGGVVTRHLALDGDRAAVRRECTRAALDLAREVLSAPSGPRGTVDHHRSR